MTRAQIRKMMLAKETPAQKAQREQREKKTVENIDSNARKFFRTPAGGWPK